MKRIILLIICLFLLCGCYDYQELNDMSIVSAIGVDYVDDNYIVNLEITKSSKDGSSTEIETKIFSGKNKNIVEAFTEAKNMSDKAVYMEHVELLILGKGLAEKGFSPVIDYIIRDTTINNNYFMVVVDDLNQIFDIKLENQSTSEVIVDTVEYYLDKTSIDDLDIIASNLLNDKQDIAIPYITLNEENIEFKEIAYFDKDILINFIDAKMYTFLELDSTNIDFTNENNTIKIYKKKIDYEVKKDEIVIKVNAYGKVEKISDKYDLEKEDSYEKLEKEINKSIKNETIEFLNKTLENNSDLLGLENKYYKKFRREKENIKYKVDVSTTVNKNGTIYGSVK